MLPARRRELRTAPRPRAEQRRRDRHQLAFLRLQGPLPGHPGNCRVERSRAVPDREQPPRGRGGKHHLRGFRSVYCAAGADRDHHPPQPRDQAARVDVAGVDRQEPDRIQKRPGRGRRGEHDREQLGRRPARLLDHVHATQPEQHRALDDRQEHHRPEQRDPPRRGRVQRVRATTTSRRASRRRTS